MATAITHESAVRITLQFSVNGESVCASVPPTERLSRVLREHLGLTGTKVGCDAGDCGACTVLLNSQPVCSCLVAAGQVQGCEVTTVEGLSKRAPVYDRLQKSFLAAHPEIATFLTAADVPGNDCYGVIPKFADQPVFAQSLARFRGEGVAAVVGEAEFLESFDWTSFPVTWQRLPAITSIEEAL